MPKITVTIVSEEDVDMQELLNTMIADFKDNNSSIYDLSLVEYLVW
jgi:hypothetical protein